MRKAVLSSRPRRSVAEAPKETRPEECDLSIVSDTVAFLIRACQIQMFRGFYEEFADVGLTPASYATLAIIDTNPGIRQGFVAGLLAFREPNMTKLVRELNAAGLVKRTRLAHDARATGLHLTPKGKKFVAEANERAIRLDHSYTDMLSAEQRAALIGMLKQILRGSRFKKDDIEFHE